MIDVGQIAFIVYLAFCLALAAFGLTRRGNPYQLGRRLAHWRAGHRHGKPHDE